ncbi:MAG: hypothetical protein HOD43_11410 [Candidatus Marinimicrobia bacterium]|jgi:hypothetical protein|nr:hypothetical protein [Candidatus Neomarinimicrobiota bacterium]MBT3630292.1 hypothetical protein [Candidatus Neomarinimicrobiota bacterium]MBT3824044.1 hypothetical protein [Candidatus Neomarinimicrobiota bacterium]MBT4132331.1 hypothetical protein [Candidatus Neomarinimicrobiota bacterium]MBT4296398.1 hypothetical protein [Candidatus Neomarinimicrobiota bacterium]
MRNTLFCIAVFTLSLFQPSFAQEAITLDTAEEHVAFAQSIYWSALTPSEKQTFLFAYISSAYEVRKLANETIATSPRNTHRFNEEIDNLFLIWQSLLVMEDNGDAAMEEFIGWIDLYFEIDVNKSSPFINAVKYAHQKVKSEDKSVLELFWGKTTAPESRLPKDEVLEQKAIERKIAASEARKSVDSAVEIDPPMAYKPLSASPTTAFVLTDEELRIIALAVETECLNKNQPDALQDPVMLESLARKHGFESMSAFNLKFSHAQSNEARWKYMNKLIIEQAFDQNCM